MGRATITTDTQGPRRTQADRRARSRHALLEAAARGLSANGYAHLVLANVAGEAGYTRGALYHQFAGKDELVLAVLEWVDQTWNAEVGAPADTHTDPVAALLSVARGHAVYCRRDLAGVMMALRVEFAGQDHPIARAMAEIVDGLEAKVLAWIEAGRSGGGLPPGPPAELTAQAYLGVLEGVVIPLAGRQPHDVVFAERAVRGVLGLPPSS